MFEFAALSSYIGALAFGLLCVLLLAADRGHFVGRLLIAASLTSTLWFALVGIYYSGYEFGIGFRELAVAELCRDVAWLAFLAAILFRIDDGAFRRRLRRLLFVSGCVIVVVAVLGFLADFPAVAEVQPALRKVSLSGFLTIAIFALVMIEQMLRSTRAEARWAIKHISLAVGAIFAFDVYVYADALLFAKIDPQLWAARGFVNALTVPMIALAAARNRDWNLEIFVSRRVVFHGAVAIAIGAYLLFMSVAGYYLNLYGGAWSEALRAVFIAGALLFLLTLIVSSQMRSHLRIFLAKHFYKNRYEYGEVWLSFTRELSTSDADPEQLRQTILRAVADIVDSTGGTMWSKDEDGSFSVSADWTMGARPEWTLASNEPFIALLGDTADLIELRHSEGDGTQAVFPWIDELPRAWIAVPIVHGEELLAFLVLADSRTNASVTWEDRDLLRTVGRQAASYLAFLRATEALTEARQFEAFNRLSAFLVHDLKNVVAQLSLIVSNAERHRDKPEFIDDAFNTVGDAVAKINRMLASLKQDTASLNEDATPLEINDLVRSAVEKCSNRHPQPSFSQAAPIFVDANYDSLQSVIQHLLQNAQDATQDDGSISVRIASQQGKAIVTIADTGCGMDEDFVRNRLFKPFDTTKGKAGMGIGVYESRHIISGLGGRLRVNTALGEGTSIDISLPLSAESQGSGSETNNEESFA